MRVTVLQDNLKRGLATVAPAIGKSSMPVLANVLVEAINGQVVLSGNDLTLAIRTRIGGKVEKDGAVTLPAKLLSDLVGNLPKDTVELALDDKTLTMGIACKGTKAKVKGIDADEYPAMRTSEATPLATISAADLASIAATVAVAAAAENTNPNPLLQGVLFQFGATNFFVAVDGYRLAVKTTEGKADGQAQQVVIPAVTLAKIAKIFAGSEEPITITPIMGQETVWVDNKSAQKDTIAQLIFENATTTAVTRVIDGQYPDWQRFVPKGAENTLIVNRAAIAAAIRRLSLFSVAAGNILTLTFWDEMVQIKASAAEIGESMETIDIKQGDYVGDQEAKIALNARYLSEAVGSITTDLIKIETVGPNSPAVFEPIGDGATYFHLVMPMRIP